MTHMDTFSKTDDDSTIDFIMADADQTYFFHELFTQWSLKADITYMVEPIA